MAETPTRPCACVAIAANFCGRPEDAARKKSSKGIIAVLSSHARGNRPRQSLERHNPATLRPRVVQRDHFPHPIRRLRSQIVDLRPVRLQVIQLPRPLLESGDQLPLAFVFPEDRIVQLALPTTKRGRQAQSVERRDLLALVARWI